MGNEQIYLKAILALLARQTFPAEKVAGLVGRDKQIAAYNLCDGTRTLAEIARESGLDPSNLRKSVNRWIDAGIIIKIIENREQKPLHVYPLPTGKSLKEKGDE